MTQLLFAFVILLTSPAHAQQFLQPTVIPIGNWPAAIYSADINSDGFPDLVYVDQGATAGASTTHILLNDGTGHFTPSATIATRGTTLAVTDIDGDGHPDIVWLESGTDGQSTLIAAAIVLGNGDGTFQPGRNFADLLVIGNTVSLANLVAGHIETSTGVLDLVFEDTRNPTLFIMHCQNGLGFCDGGTRSITGAGPIALADLNADGLQDVIVQEGPSTMAVFLGAPPFPAGTGLIPVKSFESPAPIGSFLVQPVDNDALPDLVLETTNGRFDIFHGIGDGTFAPSSEGGTGAAPGVSDGLTGHGGHLVAETTVDNGVRRNFYTATPAGISALIGQGNLSYVLQGIYNAGPGRTSYALADFNHDGYPDLAVDSPEGIAILFGTATGGFQTSQSFVAGQPAMSGALAAFNSTGTLDAVVSTAAKQAQLLHGNGDGTFTYAGSPAAPTPTTSETGAPGLWSVVTTGDFENRGKTDILLTADGPAAALPQTPDGANIQLGNGNGAFAAPQPLATRDSVKCSTAPGFLYGTSALGVLPSAGAIINRDYAFARLYPFTANQTLPNTYFEAQSPAANPCGPYAHNLAIPGLFTSKSASDVILQADGHLILFPTAANKNAPLATPLGDLSIDGSLTTPGQLTAPALSSIFNGPAIPVSSGGLGFPAFIGSAVVADLDADGNNDLIVTYANLAADPQAPVASAPNYIYLWFGAGDGTFPVSAAHPVNPVRLTPSRNFYQAAVADLNGDNIPDLILSDGYILSIQYGLGGGAFGPEQHFLAGQGLNTISVGDVDGDGKPDLVIANGGTVFSNPVANMDHLTPNPDVNTGGITVLTNTGKAPPPPPGTLSTALTATPNPAPFEAAVTLTATLTPPTGSPQPTGTVTFNIDGTLAGIAPVTTGVATLAIPAHLLGATTPPILPGAHALTAQYSGDATYPAASNLKASLTVALGPTTVTLVPTTPTPAPYGSPVNGTFSVNVLDAHYPATGTYTVLDNGVAVPECTGLVLNVPCPYGDPQILDAGPHALSVDYNGGPANGDPINASSASPPIVYSVTPDPTTTALVSTSLNPADVGTAVTLTATLTGSPATPSGTVQFFDSATLLGSATLSATGVATLTTSSLTVGTHPISVTYAPNNNFAAATSNTLQQQIVAVTAPPVPGAFTLTVTPDPVTLGVGRVATLKVSVVALGGFNQPVALACAGLPYEATCTFTQPTIPAGGGATTLQLHVTAPHDCGNPNAPYFLGQTSSPSLPGSPTGTRIALAALFLTSLTGGTFLRRRKDLRRILPAALVVASLAGAITLLNGCGHCTDLGTYPGTYAITVTATPQGTPTTQPQSQKITLSVTN